MNLEEITKVLEENKELKGFAVFKEGSECILYCQGTGREITKCLSNAFEKAEELLPIFEEAIRPYQMKSKVSEDELKELEKAKLIMELFEALGGKYGRN